MCNILVVLIIYNIDADNSWKAPDVQHIGGVACTMQETRQYQVWHCTRDHFLHLPD